MPKPPGPSGRKPPKKTGGITKLSRAYDNAKIRKHPEYIEPKEGEMSYAAQLEDKAWEDWIDAGNSIADYHNVSVPIFAKQQHKLNSDKKYQTQKERVSRTGIRTLTGQTAAESAMRKLKRKSMKAARKISAEVDEKRHRGDHNSRHRSRQDTGPASEY